MQQRTDLALENKEMHNNLPNGVTCKEEKRGEAKVTIIDIINDEGEKALGRKRGKYITVEVPAFSDNVHSEELLNTVIGQLNFLLPKGESVLVVGLGNRNITPDALGPLACDSILATRHIEKELARSAGIKKINSISVLVPGVLGQTGIEAFNIIKGVVEEISPSAVIVIDALASLNVSRLGCTLQMSNTGIEPGAGVGNARFEISEKTLGVPVIAMGVPTVVDATNLVRGLVGEGADLKPDGRQMIVTPREIDLLIDRAATLISEVINFALNPNISRSLIKSIIE